jgi:hypothetical protein
MAIVLTRGFVNSIRHFLGSTALGLGLAGTSGHRTVFQNNSSAVSRSPSPRVGALPGSWVGKEDGCEVKKEEDR